MKIDSVSPQFLVDDLKATIGFYRLLGFEQVIDYQGNYASVARDGQSIHLKCAPKLEAEREHRKTGEHLDAYFMVTDIDGLVTEFESRGLEFLKPLETRPWGVRDCYVEDPDGYVLCFGEDQSP